MIMSKNNEMSQKPQSEGETSFSSEERSIALEAILAYAEDLGIDEAIRKFGEPLYDTEKNLIRSLSVEEIKSLNSIDKKLKAAAKPKENNNNNNNNAKPK